MSFDSRDSQEQEQALKQKTDEYTKKLLGLKVVQEQDHFVQDTTILQKDLPQNTRVLPPGAVATRDFRPDRLNVTTDGEGTIKGVYFG